MDNTCWQVRSSTNTVVWKEPRQVLVLEAAVWAPAGQSPAATVARRRVEHTGPDRDKPVKDRNTITLRLPTTIPDSRHDVHEPIARLSTDDNRAIQNAGYPYACPSRARAPRVLRKPVVRSPVLRRQRTLCVKNLCGAS